MLLIVSMTTTASSLLFGVGRNADIEVDWGMELEKEMFSVIHTLMEYLRMILNFMAQKKL